MHDQKMQSADSHAISTYKSVHNIPDYYLELLPLEIMVLNFIKIFLLVSTFNIIQSENFGGRRHFDYIVDDIINLSTLPDQHDGLEVVNISICIEKNSSTIFNINAKVEQLVELDDDYLIEFKILLSDDGARYETLFEFPTLPLCQFMKIYYPYLYHTLKDYSTAPSPDSCPLKPAKYLVEDFPLDLALIETYTTQGYYITEVRLRHKTDPTIEVLYVIYGLAIEI